MCPQGLLPSAQQPPPTYCPTTPTAVTIPAGAALVPAAGDAQSGNTCIPTAGMYCGYYNMYVTIPNDGSAHTLPAGTYFFVNSTLDIEGDAECTTNATGTTLKCDPNDTPMQRWRLRYRAGTATQSS